MKKIMKYFSVYAILLLICVAPLSTYANALGYANVSFINSYASKRNDGVLYFTRDGLLSFNGLETYAVERFSLSGFADTYELKTFDESKVFSGTSESGSRIAAVIFADIGNDCWVPINGEYSVEVGGSGLFNLPIDLPLGEHIIVFEATKDNRVSYFTIVVNRKPAEIKEKLKKAIDSNGVVK